MSRIITAIDIGSYKISVAIATVDEEGNVKIIGEAQQSSQGIRKGEITGIDDAVNSIALALNSAERMAGISVSSAYVSINGRQVLSNNNKGVVAIAGSEVIENDVYRAMEQAKTIAIPNTREIVHLIPREFIVDQQNGIKVPIGMTGNRLEVDAHIISFPITSIHNLEKCVQSIGLKVDSFVFTGWASALSVLTPTEKELGVLLLDVGGGTVSVTMFMDDCVTYSASIPLGGINVTRDLATGLRLSLDDAEKIKLSANDLLRQTHASKKYKKTVKLVDSEVSQIEDDEGNEEGDVIDVSGLGIEGIKTISRKFFLQIISDRMEEIFNIVKDNIEQAGFSYKLPAGVVLTGGGSLLPDITSIVKNVLGVPARVAQPKGVSGLVSNISPSLAVTYGLIIYALQEEIQRGDSKYSGSAGKRSMVSGDSLVSKIFGLIRKIIPS